MDENALIARSQFEDLLIRINKENEGDLTSELNQDRRRNLLKSICSVYFFLCKVAEMKRRDMTVEEFEIAEEKLKEMAKEDLKKSRHKILGAIGFKTAWSYYAKFGYFHIIRTPFGSWWKFHNWYRKDWNNFDPNRYIENYNNYTATPPNAKHLLNELFEKRFRARSKE